MDAQGNTKKVKRREITVGEAKDILQSVLKTPIVPFLWGPPGVGKSSIVKEIAKEKGWKIIDLRLSLLNPVDLRGLPTVDHKEKKADWLPPSFLPKEDEKEPGLLFLDEINLAPLSVQAAAYQLILDKQIGDYKFPPTWKIVAAGNREIDKANVYKISAPLANRFVHFTVRPDFFSWKTWAKQEGVHEAIIQFLSLRPVAMYEPPVEQEKAFPSPRSWQFVSDMLQAFGYTEDDDVPDALQQVIIGSIGEGTGSEVITFLNSFKMKEVTKKLQQLKDTGKIALPRSTSVRFALIGAVFEEYKHGALSPVHYDAFTNLLMPEEKKTIAEFEKEEAGTLAKKYSNVNRSPSGSARTETVKELGIGETEELFIKDSTGFDAPGIVIAISPDGKTQEMIAYSSVMLNKLTGLDRDTNKQGARRFPVGSTVTKL